MKKIGVFDSGIGGRAIAKSLEALLKDSKIFVVDDHLHLPYGEKSPQEIRELTDRAIQPLLEQNCDVIVLACNTATTNAIKYLRDKYQDQKFVGIEPMIKPAAKMTKTGTIAIFATRGTLSSPHYKQLVHKYASDLTVLEPDCSDWASMIQNQAINQQKIADIVNGVCDQGADVIVLGCTHYHWIKQLIDKLAAGRAEIIEPTEAIARQIKSVLNS